MANFNEAFDITMGHEGGYIDDKDDVGGETYRGIARRYNPDWEGWEIIDETKPDINFDEMDPYVRKFYKNRYWDEISLDDFPQAIANELFDTAVNMGTKRAAMFIQETLNYMNRNGSLYDELVVDGLIGRKTLSALDRLPPRDDIVILKILNVLQGQHYLNYMKKSPTQEKFARGWFSRISLGE